MDCAICMDTIQNISNELTTPCCKNCIHSSCMTTWLLENDTCPLCRYNIGQGKKETLEEIDERNGEDEMERELRDQYGIDINLFEDVLEFLNDQIFVDYHGPNFDTFVSSIVEMATMLLADTDVAQNLGLSYSWKYSKKRNVYILALKTKNTKTFIDFNISSDGANLMLYYKYTVQEKKIGTTKFQKQKLRNQYKSKYTNKSFKNTPIRCY